MAEKQDNAKNRQPNKITLARENFSLLEKRIVLLAINQIKTGINVQPDLFKNVDFLIPAKDLNETNRQRLKTACENITSRKVRMEAEDGKGFEILVPFPYAKYDGSTLKLKMLSDVMPHYAELKGGYTTYGLKAALSLSKTYSQKLYELLSRFKDTGVWVKQEITYIRDILGLLDKYKKWSTFEQYVIKDSQKEINEKTDISFTYELFKTGKTYTHITFYITENDLYEDDMEIQFENLEETVLTDKQKRCIESLKSISIVDPRLINTIIESEELQTNFWVWWSKYKQGNFSKVKNHAGLLLKTLGVR